MPTDRFPMDPGNPTMGEVVIGVDFGRGRDASVIAVHPPTGEIPELGEHGCLYVAELEVLNLARQAAQRGERLEVPWRTVPPLVEALESLGRLRERRLEFLARDLRALPDAERGGEGA